MFFDEELVTNRRFKNVWRAAHNQEADTDDVEIPSVCDSISTMMNDYSDNKLRHLSFRTAYTLFLGTVKTYKKQLDKLSKDAFDLAYEMEFGTPNVLATGDSSNDFQADRSSNEADKENSNPGDKETSINIGDSDDNEEELNGNTRADEEPEEHFDPGDEETSINNGDLNDSEDELSGNTRAGSRKRKSDDEECWGEGTSSMAGTSGAHRSKVIMTSPEVHANKYLKKDQELKELHGRKDPGLDNDLPVARIAIYAAGSRRHVKTVSCNDNSDMMSPESPESPGESNL